MTRGIAIGLTLLLMLDRKVILRRKQPGKDAEIGTNFSDPLTGDWQIGGKAKPGTYYAKVKRVEIPAGICWGDRSKDFSL